MANRRLWRLSAKVLGKLGEQFEKSSQDPVAAWLGVLSHTLEPPIEDARRTGAVLAICEWLRISEQHRWIWDTLESLPGVGVAATRSSLVTTSFGDVKTTK